MRCARVGLFGFVLAAAVALPGCLSETPIAPGAATPIDERLVGTWRCVSGNQDVVSILTIARQSATAYAGTLAEFGHEPGSFEAYLVGRGSNALANVKDLETDSAERWTLMRPTLYRPDLLHVETVDSDHKAPGFSAALKDPKKRDALFEDAFTCVRVPPKT